MIWFTADEHHCHKNIIKYCNRPFRTTEEMSRAIVARHNEVVKGKDIVIHAGDFCLGFHKQAMEIVEKLNGSHVFLKGGQYSHDKWLGKESKYMWFTKISRTLVTVCHYAMLTWPLCHYNSWQLFGHSHGRLTTSGKQHDIGVDTNNFYPYSEEDIVRIMKDKPDNPAFIALNKRKQNESKIP